MVLFARALDATNQRTLGLAEWLIGAISRHTYAHALCCCVTVVLVLVRARARGVCVCVCVCVLCCVV
jgi:hypothetical protein